MSDNTITIIGNLTKDPELRFTAGGRGHASFGLAVNRRYQVNNQWQEQVSFFNRIAWGNTAENLAASFSKGQRAIVTGRLEQRSYETQQGEKRSVVEIVVDDIGPSLRWARAEIEKVTREGGDNSGGRSSQPSSNPARDSRPPDPVYEDEEPF